MVRHHLKVVTEAAKRHIAIDRARAGQGHRAAPHLSRTGSRAKAQRGMEYNAWGEPKNPPEHEANLVFTRMLSGPMDFTPGILSLKGKGNTPILSTLAKQLALYVVIYSPIQMAADLPENYEANPRPFQFIKDVPVDWDDTAMLAGEVGDFAVIARKDRNSANWYPRRRRRRAASGSSTSRSIFLAPGRRYRAEIYRDGDRADYRTNPRDHRHRAAHRHQRRPARLADRARRRRGGALRGARQEVIGTR